MRCVQLKFLECEYIGMFENEVSGRDYFNSGHSVPFIYTERTMSCVLCFAMPKTTELPD